MMVVATLGIANAAEVNFDFTNPVSYGYAAPDLGGGATDIPEGGTIKSGIITITCAQNGASNPTRFWGGTNAIDLRAYKPATLTITTTNGDNITNIAIAGAKVEAKLMTFDVGTYTSSSAKAGTWTGSASTITITMAATTNFSSFTFTTVASSGTAAPTFSPKGGTFYSAQEVTIASATPGATIHYTLDGSTPTTASAVYSAPIAIANTTTVKAIAIAAGVNSEVSEATYTIATVPTVANIAAFIAGPTDSPVQITNPVYVVYQNGPNLYIKDETGFLLVYGTITAKYNNGDKIAGGITGKMELYNGIPEMTNLVDNSFAAGEAGATITPESKGVGQIGIDMVNQYVIIYDVTIAATEVAKNYTLSDGEDLIAAYAKFADVVFPTDANKYDVTGLVTIFKNAVQIYPTAIVKNTGVSNVETATTSIVAANGAININTEVAAEAIVINGAGQVVAQKAVVAGANSIEVAAGFYIVKVANKVAKVIVK